MTAQNEQQLIESIVSETIFQRGNDITYIPRINSEIGADYLFGEDPGNIFSNGVIVEAYLLEIRDGFGGQDIIGHFGLEIDDEATILISRTRFAEEITARYPNITRPQEGDLLLWKFDPVNESKFLFEITYIGKDHPFFTIGRSTLYRLTCKRFIYTHETMQTGEPIIDNQDMGAYENYNENNNLKEESDTFVDFSEEDPFSDGTY